MMGPHIVHSPSEVSLAYCKGGVCGLTAPFPDLAVGLAQEADIVDCERVCRT